MSSPIVQIAYNPSGYAAVALHSDGTLHRQSGKPAVWQPVSLDGYEGGQIKQVAVANDQLVILTAAGELWEDYSPAYTALGTRRWRRMAGPE